MMRPTCLAVMICATVSTVSAQAPPAARYGVPAAPFGYPQATPQEALASAVKAIENRRTEYLAGHLIDPAAIDARIGERAKRDFDAVDKEFRLLRESQIRQGLLRKERLSDEEGEFTAAVQAEVANRAFRNVVAAVGEQLQQTPETLKLFRKFAREGVLNEAADSAALTLAGVPGVQVNFRKVGDRWYIGDRKTPEPVQQR